MDGWRDSLALMEIAVDEGDREMVYELCLEGLAGTQARLSNFDTPWHRAAERGDVEMLRYLGEIEQSMDGVITGIHSRDIDRRIPLHRAAWRNDVGAVELLIGQGSDVDALDGSGDTPSHLAIRRVPASALRTLRAGGAMWTIANDRGDAVCDLRGARSSRKSVSGC